MRRSLFRGKILTTPRSNPNHGQPKTTEADPQMQKIDTADTTQPKPTCIERIESAPPAILDRVHLGRYTMGDVELEREILQLFIGQLRETLNNLQSAADPAAWRQAAHTLKGSAKAVGAWQLAQEAEQAEQVTGQPQAWPLYRRRSEASAALTTRYIAETYALQSRPII